MTARVTASPNSINERFESHHCIISQRYLPTNMKVKEQRTTANPASNGVQRHERQHMASTPVPIRPVLHAQHSGSENPDPEMHSKTIEMLALIRGTTPEVILELELLQAYSFRHEDEEIKDPAKYSIDEEKNGTSQHDYFLCDLDDPSISSNLIVNIDSNNYKIERNHMRDELYDEKSPELEEMFEMDL